MATITAERVTLTQNGKTYRKIMLTNEDIQIIEQATHMSRHNHVVWDKPCVRGLSDMGKQVRVCARRGDALRVGTDYLLRF